MKIRFQENLNIDLDIPNTDNWYIIPAALQMLIENAIKHNEVSKSNPLAIKIHMEGDWLQVENQLHAKSSEVSSTKIGLNNIRDRYVLLQITPPEIIQNEEKFVVRIPLIKTEEP